jgi:hypothetical protein
MKNNFLTIVEDVLSEGSAPGASPMPYPFRSQGQYPATSSSPATSTTPATPITPIKTVYELSAPDKAPRIWQEFTVLCTTVRASVGEIPSKWATVGKGLLNVGSGLLKGFEGASGALSKF